MKQVYRTMGILGWRYWLDDGLTKRPITKKRYDEIVMDVKIKREVHLQMQEAKKN